MTTSAHSRLQALADPTRSRLLLALEKEELSVSELVAALQLPQSTISRHLKVLTDEGWVSSRAEGTSRFYRLVVDEGAWGERVWHAVRPDFEGSTDAKADRARLARVLADRRRRSREYFAGVAGRWEEVREELFGGDLDLQLAFALLQGTEVIGDLGCGTGFFASRIAPHVRSVIAVDGSEPMLAEARARTAAAPNVDVRSGDLEQLPIVDEALDIAVMSLALQYVTNPSRAIAEAHRVLRRGGRLVVLDMTPHNEAQLAEAMGHVWRGFDDQQFMTWLTAAGFINPHYRVVADDTRSRSVGIFLGTGTRR